MIENFYASSSEEIMKRIMEWLENEKNKGYNVEITSLALVQVYHNHFEAVLCYNFTFSE